jgi:trans-aconitate 2-methyltransferase
MPWSPSQYLKFEDERTRPSKELLARVPLGRAANVVDLGCGPGNSTELLIERFGAAAVSAVDNNPAMLSAARTRLPATPFIEADLATWKPIGPVDLLFSNATFQWVPNHLAVLDRLMDVLVPGGMLAVQMPDNVLEPSHQLMDVVSREGPWRAQFESAAVTREVLPKPSVYYELLTSKSAHVDIWHTHYYHVLRDAAAIVDWFKGSALRSYLEVLNTEQQLAFEAEYLARIMNAYTPMTDGRVLLRFPRLFMVAVRA